MLAGCCSMTGPAAGSCSTVTQASSVIACPAEFVTCSTADLERNAINEGAVNLPDYPGPQNHMKCFEGNLHAFNAAQSIQCSGWILLPVVDWCLESQRCKASAAVEKNPQWHAIKQSTVHEANCGRQKKGIFQILSRSTTAGDKQLASCLPVLQHQDRLLAGPR